MIQKIGRFVTRHYRLIFILYLLFVGINAYFATKLKLSTQMSDMLPKDDPSFVAYDKAIKNFEGIDLISVVIEGNESDITSFMKSLKPQIEKMEYIKQVISGPERNYLKENGLLMMKEKSLRKMDGFFSSNSLAGFLKGLNDNFEEEYISGDDDQSLSRDKQKILQTFNTIEDFVSYLMTAEKDAAKIIALADDFFMGKEFMISPDRTLGVMFVKSTIDMTDVEKVGILVNSLEKLVKSNQEKYNVRAGISGILVLQRDEMVATEEDMRISSVVSLFLILLIFYLGFKLIRYSVLAVIPLVAGIMTSLGLTYFAVGQLNLFTAMMGVILIGLGIDYAIHIISIYTEERAGGVAVDTAIRNVFSKTAKGVVTGSITTAISFLMFSVSSFPGFREFGVVLGIGIISIMFSSLIMLPPLFKFFGKKKIKLYQPRYRMFKNSKEARFHRARLLIGATIILMIISIAGFGKIEFSKNIKDIEPKGLESLAISDKLIEKFDMSQDVTIVTSESLNRAYDLKEKAEKLDTVGMVDSIVDYLPPIEKQRERLKIISEIKNQMKPMVEKDVEAKLLKGELDRLKNNLIEMSDLAYMGGEKKLVGKIDEIMKKGIFAKLSPQIEGSKNSIGRFQQIFMSHFMKNVREANSTKVLSVDDLPQNIVKNYIGKDGSYLTIIYPEGDVWSEKFQEMYFLEIENLKEFELTGTFILNNIVMSIAGEEGKRVLIYVVIVCFLVLLIDFRSFKYAIMAMLPMIGTMILTLGTMGWFGIKFDYVNIMALPIIIGIGIDDGVHIIHRYLAEKDIIIAMKSTGRGVLLSSLTTCAAFGTLMLGTYQGFANFGLLLVIGIAIAYLLTVLFLTSLVLVVDKDRMKGGLNDL